MKELRSGVLHNGRRFYDNNYRGGRFASMPAVDQILAKAIVRSHRMRISSGNKRSMERVHLGIPHIGGKDREPSQPSPQVVKDMHPEDRTKKTPCAKLQPYAHMSIQM